MVKFLKFENTGRQGGVKFRIYKKFMSWSLRKAHVMII